MCYLPVKCLKAIVFIGSICAIAISIGLLARKAFLIQSPSTSRSKRNKSSVQLVKVQSRVRSLRFISLLSCSCCWELPDFRDR